MGGGAIEKPGELALICVAAQSLNHAFARDEKNDNVLFKT